MLCVHAEHEGLVGVHRRDVEDGELLGEIRSNLPGVGDVALPQIDRDRTGANGVYNGKGKPRHVSNDVLFWDTK